MPNNDTLRSKMIEVIDSMLEKNLNPIFGARFISDNRFGLDNESSINFDFFVMFVSETQPYPSLEGRDLCSREYLKKLDEEFGEYIDRMQDEIDAACRKLRVELQ